MDLTSSDTVLPSPPPSATNLAPFLYESTGGRRRKTRKSKSNNRKNKSHNRKSKSRKNKSRKTK